MDCCVLLVVFVHLIYNRDVEFFLGLFLKSIPVRNPLILLVILSALVIGLAKGKIRIPLVG